MRDLTPDAILFAAVADFHAANAVAGYDQDQRRDNDQTRHRDPGGSGLGDDREWSFRNRHWYQRVEVVNNAYFFQQRRH